MRKKTLICVLSFALVGAMTGLSATYAWYTAKSFLTAGETKVHLASSSLRLGVDKGDGIVYDDHLDPDDIERLAPAFYQKRELGDVSAMMAYRWQGKDVPELYTLRGEKADEGSYLQFRLYCYSDEEADLYFDSFSSLKMEKAGSPLEKALRLSIYDGDAFYLFHFAEDIGPVAYAGPLDIDPQDGYYDTDHDKEILYGDYEGEPRYLKEEGDVASPHKPGVYVLDPSSYTPRYEKAIPFRAYQYEEGAKKTPLLRLSAKTPTPLVFTLFAEGWDPHLTDQVKGEGFRLDLGLFAHFTPR